MRKNCGFTPNLDFNPVFTKFNLPNFCMYKHAPESMQHINAVREEIMPLIQDQENGGYLEDGAISSLSQGVEIPHLFSYIVQSMIFLQDTIKCC